MSYIGNEPFSVAFLTDTFSGNGSTTSFTLSASPAGTSSILVAISGVVQDPSTYSVIGTTLTFSPAPPTGTGNISVRFLGIPASGVATTAYRTVTEFTATAGQTTFSVPSYTPGFVDVYRNGVMLGSADYTASNGVSVVLASGATSGDLVEVISFSVSSVANAIPSTAGSVGTTNIASGVTINFADGSASAPSITNDGDTNTGIFFPAADTIAFAEGGAEVARFDSSGNLGIGTSSPSYKLDVTGQCRATTGWAVSSDGSAFTPSGLNAIPNYGTGYITSTSITTLAGFGGVSLYTNQAERMRIDGSGRLLVGTTSVYSGLEKFIVLQTSTDWNSVFRTTNTSANSYGVLVSYVNTPNGTGNWFYRAEDTNGTNIRFEVRSNGGIGNYQANNVNLSDAREKTNIELAGSYLDKICAIPVKTFNYIDQNREDDDGLTLGVIAQDVQAVAPELVMESNWAGKDEEPKMRLSIYQTDLQYALMKCIQELKAEVDLLKAEVTALKGTE
jgi:hypothetical protein